MRTLPRTRGTPRPRTRSSCASSTRRSRSRPGGPPRPGHDHAAAGLLPRRRLDRHRIAGHDRERRRERPRRSGRDRANMPALKGRPTAKQGAQPSEWVGDAPPQPVPFVPLPSLCPWPVCPLPSDNHLVTSIVVHYGEIALKGSNRPWFVSRLVRNIAGDLGGLDVRDVRARWWVASSSPWDPTATRSGTRCATRLTQLPASAISRARRTWRPTSTRCVGGGSGGARENGWATRQTTSFRVSARRADKRFPLTSPQIEREVGGRIKEARGWTVNLDESRAARFTSKTLTNEAFYFLRQGAGRRRPAGRRQRPRRVPALGRHRLSGRGVAADAPRLPVLFVHFHSYPILSRASQEKARELAQLLTRVPVPLAAVPRAVRRDPAAGRPRGRAAAAGRDLSPPDDAHRRGASRGSIGRRRW